jgi:uncharacterized Zn finger protein
VSRWSPPTTSFAERHAEALAPVRAPGAPREKPAPAAPPVAGGSSWWAQRWIAALERFSTEFGHRLERGREYAQTGRVHDMRLEGPVVVAAVSGSRPEDYEVRISLERIEDRTWEQVTEAMASRAAFIAALLAGEMPQEIDQAFSQGGSHLFPASEEDLWTSCTCPDWANPCKHVAAAHYVLAELIDNDPFVLFDMRGRSREEVLTALRRARGAEPERPSLVAISVLGVEPDLSKGYDVAKGPLQVKVRIQAPPIPAAVLRQIGTPAVWSVPVPINEVLGPVFEGAGSLARSIALAVDSEVLAAMQAEAAPPPPPVPTARPRPRRQAAQPSGLLATPVMPVVIRRKKAEVQEPAPASAPAPVRRRRPR